MTKRPRRADRHTSRTIGQALLAIVAVIAAIVFVAPVADAGDGGPSALGVQPVEVDLGGQQADCSQSVTGRLPSAAPYDFRVVNPKDTTTATSPEGATFTMSVNGNNTLLDFSVSEGFVVYDVIIKGGANSAHFDYDTNGGPGPVLADAALHAPTKGNGNNLYSVSHISFCFGPAVAISGTVFDDLNQNGVQDAGEPAAAPQSITVYDSAGEPVGTVVSDANGDWTVYVPQNDTYTICQDSIDGYVQTTPGNGNCVALGDSEPGGYTVAIGVDPAGGFVFGSSEEICGQNLVENGVVFTGSFELFENGDGESGCENKAGILFETTDGAGNAVLALPLVGDGEVAGIGVITKQFGSPSDFVAIQYAQSATDGFEELQWCTLRARVAADGNQFDPYLSDLSTYPSLVGVTDPISGDPAVSCKVHEVETIEGVQTTVVYVQDDPFWQ